MKLGHKLLLILVLLVLTVTGAVILLVGQRVSRHERSRIEWELETSVESFERVQREAYQDLALHGPTWFEHPHVLAQLDSFAMRENMLAAFDPFLRSLEFGDAYAFAGIFYLTPMEREIVLAYPPIASGPQDYFDGPRRLLEDPDFQARLPIDEVLFDAAAFHRTWVVHDGRLFLYQALPLGVMALPGEPPRDPQAALFLFREATDDFARAFILDSVAAVGEDEETVPSGFEGGREAVFVVGDRVVASSRSQPERLAEMGPAFAAAAASGEARGIEEFRVGSERLIGEWRTLGGTEPRAGYVVFKSYDRALVHLNQLQRLLGALGGSVTLFAVAVAFAVTASIVRPVGRLVTGTRAVEGGKLDVEVEVTTKDEIGDLTRSFNRMVSELRLKEHIKSQFGKYVDPKIVEDLIANPDAAKIGGDRRVMTVFFSDIAGFTSIAEGLSPESLVLFLNEYLTAMTDAIVRREGVIDKYIGDAIMAFWGPPFVAAGRHASAACLAALDQLDRLGELRRSLEARGLPAISIRVGISTGEMIVGNVGSSRSQSYTVMGDRVNLASRLEGANKIYGTRLLVDEETARAAGDAVEVREIDSIQVVGKNEPVRVFEVLARRGELDPRRAELREHYEGGLGAYRAAEFAQAEARFDECLRIDDSDPPTLALLERLRQLAERPPTRGWTGVWRLEQK